MAKPARDASTMIMISAITVMNSVFPIASQYFIFLMT